MPGLGMAFVLGAAGAIGLLAGAGAGGGEEACPGRETTIVFFAESAIEEGAMGGALGGGGTAPGAAPGFLDCCTGKAAVISSEGGAGIEADDIGRVTFKPVGGPLNLGAPPSFGPPPAVFVRGGKLMRIVSFLIFFASPSGTVIVFLAIAGKGTLGFCGAPAEGGSTGVLPNGVVGLFLASGKDGSAMLNYLSKRNQKSTTF
ncbi:MAG: hypothetical protein AAF984_03870 [Verrucomicrobiota bacterium]